MHAPVEHPLDRYTFIKWLKSKNQDEPYDYCDPYACPIARFLQDKGYLNAHVGGDCYNLRSGFNDNIPIPEDIATACALSRSFGQLLHRLTKEENHGHAQS